MKNSPPALRHVPGGCRWNRRNFVCSADIGFSLVFAGTKLANTWEPTASGSLRTVAEVRVLTCLDRVAGRR